MTFIDALGKELAERKLSRRETAQGAGVPIGTMNAWFSMRASEPSVEAARLVLRWLNLSLEQLLQRHNPAPSDSVSESSATYGNPLAQRLYRIAQELTQDDVEDLIALAEAKRKRMVAKDLQSGSGS